MLCSSMLCLSAALCNATHAVFFFLTVGLCERNEDVNKVVGDSIRLVQAYERLAGEHSATLPKIVNGLEKYIEELKTAVASSSDR